MKITVAIDSFKGSLSTIQSGEAVLRAAREVFPDATVYISPLADGGEGTVAAVTSATGGEIRRVRVTGPLGEEVDAEYGITPDGIAVIEMSSASGITLVSSERRDPLRATTYGVGQLIADAIKNNKIRNFILGIGGSATNDGGAGMLAALGFGLFDADGAQISPDPLGLSRLCAIDTSTALPELSECRFRVACDVTNPLLGKNGASAVYGPQKGATAEMVSLMDGWLSHFAQLTAATVGRDCSALPGAGAAGGLGFALISYLNASLESGIDLVIEATDLERFVSTSDLVVTGEGRLDGQSCMGKAPVGVAKLAKKHGKTVIAFCGVATPDAVKCNSNGIDAYFPIPTCPLTLEEAMDVRRASYNLEATARQVFLLYRAALTKKC